MKRKILTIFLVFILGICALSLIGCDSCGRSQDVSYELSSDGMYYIYVGPVDNNVKDVEIKSEYNDLPVKEIGSSAFKDCYSLENITIPDSVAIINSEVFEDCDNLKYNQYDNGLYLGNDDNEYLWFIKVKNTNVVDLKINSNAKHIYQDAFYGCESLLYNEYDNGLYLGNSENERLVLVKAKNKEITSCKINSNTRIIYNSAFNGCTKLETIIFEEFIQLEDIGYRAFLGCSIKDITIPNKVEIIRSGLFENCNKLESITIPDSITYIKTSAFDNCNSLKNITVNSSNKNYSSQDGILFDKQQTKFIYIPKAITGNINIPNGVTDLDKDTFVDYGKLASITVSEDNINYSSQDGILYNKAKTEFIHIPKAISGNVTIPNTITKIGSSDFSNRGGLQSISIPNSVTEISRGAFSGCGSLQYTEYENGCYLGNSTNEYLVLVKAKNKNILKFNVNAKTKFIDSGAFEGCNKIEGISVEEGNTVYKGDSNCLIESATNTLILGCKNSVIPNYVKNIDNSAFYNCSELKNIVIPDNVESIGVAAFYNCNKLESIAIGKGVKKIETDAFYGCVNLKEIKYNATECDDLRWTDHYSYYLFSGAGKSGTGITLTISSNVKKIPAHLFASIENKDYVANITQVVIEENSVLESIGEGAFSNCTTLNGVYISDLEFWCKIDFISKASNPLNYAQNLYLNNQLVIDLEIPNTITEIKDYAFTDCNKLKSITIPSSVKSIGFASFSGCSSLTNITFTGTKEQWKAISKDNNWNSNTGDYIVYCTDGNLDKSGNPV